MDGLGGSLTTEVEYMGEEAMASQTVGTTFPDTKMRSTALGLIVRWIRPVNSQGGSISKCCRAEHPEVYEPLAHHR